MSTYKKSPSKTKAVKEAKIEVEDSTTAEVFNTLDETANISEKWIEKNQKFLFIALIVVTLSILAYVSYDKYIQTPKELEASNELAFPKKSFKDAWDKDEDNLFEIALEGVDDKYGLVDITKEYSGTKAGNLANYYVGLSYLRLKRYEEAISYLKNFSSSDKVLKPIAIAAIGDAYSDLGNYKEAISYYNKAANTDDNGFSKPMFLLKSAKLSMDIGEFSDAEKTFKSIKRDFPKSEQARDIDMYINKAIYSQK
ncbi:MAG: tetratricopeptide repeat protein [Flavobacteriaceae bacterium]|nr:tetratricopeptide repeat protein [Flavobacteriaceae bacterium]